MMRVYSAVLMAVAVAGGFAGGMVLGSVVVAAVGESATFDWSILLEQVQLIAANFGPWGLLVAAGIGVFLRFRRPATPAVPPVVPPGPVPDPAPGPLPLPLPGTSGRPFLDWLMRILGRVAVAKYPHLKPEEAVERWAIDQASTAFYYEEKAREEKAARDADVPF